MTSNEQKSPLNGYNPASTNGDSTNVDQKQSSAISNHDNKEHTKHSDTLRHSGDEDDLGNESAADGQPNAIGTSCIVMKLWEGRTATDQLVWLTEPPEIETEEESISESPKYAITLLHRIVKEKSKQILETIIVRSPELRQFLEDTIPNITALYNEAEHGLAIRSPFRMLFWHLDHIAEATKSDNQALSEAAALLQDVLKEEFRDLLVKRKELIAAREMNFPTVWTLFKPGITCLTSYADNIVGVKVTAIEFSRDPMGNLYYRIKFTTIAWDGEYFGWQDSYADIMEFTGRRKIKDLEIFPVEFHEDPNIIGQLAQRGRKFVGLAVKEPYMMSFSGEALDRETSPMWWQGEQKKKVCLQNSQWMFANKSDF